MRTVPWQRQDLGQYVGSRFGRLTAVGFPDVPRNAVRLVVCRCDCGATKTFNWHNVRRGASLSCGCLHAERTSDTSRTHGMTKTPEHRAWTSMKTRCENPNCAQYANYGGRGIKVCDRWREFEAFYEDMGPRPSSSLSLDRIDSDGGYSPENCRWASDTVQARNRRSNRTLTHDGVSRTLAEWSELTGIRHATILYRLRKGMSVSEALTTPVD